MDNKLGDKIKELRKKHNITQKELADKLNVTYQAVSKWERGINYPDISIIKEISNLYNIDINELMDIEVKKRPAKNIYLVLLSILIVILTVIMVNVITPENLELKSLSTTCQNFKLSGSIAYNKEKSSIHISTIDYCGVDETTIYKSIKSKLFESENGEDKLINETKESNNLSIKDYLQNMSIHVDNYKKTCKLYNDSSIYINLELVGNDDKTIIYKIPLKLTDDCK